MSLFGALSSGVSGLTAQSSAMGAISDNITNVNTVGYKNTRVDFQTLVTKQTSSTFYSAGGVQSKPRSDTGVQGLLQASTSSTDISISGQGYFVVNEAGVPTNQDKYLYTRAGSFFQDNDGYLRNTSGYYLQGWPTDASGTVVTVSGTGTANQNIVSTTYLETVNLNRVGGTASATTSIAIGANLPANDAAGVTHRTDVQFFDTLGNANTVSFVYTKSSTTNEWDLTIEPPSGTAVMTLYNTASGSTTQVYKSIGQLEFTAQPSTAAEVIIDGISYDFGSGGGDTSVVIGSSVASTVANLLAAVQATANFTTTTATDNQAALKSGDTSTIIFTGGDAPTAGMTDFVIDVTNLNAAGTTAAATKQGLAATKTYTIQADNMTDASANNALEFTSSGLPSAFNVIEAEIVNFSSGAANMDAGTGNAARIALDFGTAGEANGMTQFGASFTPQFITQNGSRFGTFAGLTIGVDGQVTALFDNGETRKIFKLPIATFVNVNQLESSTGNVWNATEASGDYTLREVDSGPAGQVIQGALEASTVDIGEEFTKLIVVQRAYSAAAKIISTADQMLAELMRVKS